MTLADQIRFVRDPNLADVRNQCRDCLHFQMVQVSSVDTGWGLCTIEKWDKEILPDLPACVGFRRYASSK